MPEKSKRVPVVYYFPAKPSASDVKKIDAILKKKE
jgi:hypothetical protein